MDNIKDVKDFASTVESRTRYAQTQDNFELI